MMKINIAAKLSFITVLQNPKNKILTVFMAVIVIVGCFDSNSDIKSDSNIYNNNSASDGSSDINSDSNSDSNSE